MSPTELIIEGAVLMIAALLWFSGRGPRHPAL